MVPYRDFLDIKGSYNMVNGTVLICKRFISNVSIMAGCRTIGYIIISRSCIIMTRNVKYKASLNRNKNITTTTKKWPIYDKNKTKKQTKIFSFILSLPLSVRLILSILNAPLLQWLWFFTMCSCASEYASN